VPTRDVFVKLRLTASERDRWTATARAEGSSLSEWIRVLANGASFSSAPLHNTTVGGVSEPEPAPETRRFAQTAPVTTTAPVKADVPTEQEIRERIRLRELRKSAPKSSDACPARHMRGVRCKFCKSVG
jgi:hypothetical protein